MNMQPRLIAVAAASVLGLSACATTYPGSYAGSPPPVSSSGVCYDCGTVTRIETTGVVGTQRSGATGAVIGGLVGAAAGRQITNDNVYVRMDDGRETVVTQTDLGGIREGTRVRVYNGRAWVR